MHFGTAQALYNDLYPGSTVLHVTCILIGEVLITSNCMTFELHPVCVCARVQILLDVLGPVEDHKIGQLISYFMLHLYQTTGEHCSIHQSNTDILDVCMSLHQLTDEVKKKL
jgi:hypothetical protein